MMHFTCFYCFTATCRAGQGIFQSNYINFICLDFTLPYSTYKSEGILVYRYTCETHAQVDSSLTNVKHVNLFI